MIWNIKLSLNNEQTPEQTIHIQIDTDTATVNVSTAKTDAERENGSTPVFQELMMSIIEEKAQNGHIRTAECYRSALKSFDRYMQNRPVALSEISTLMMNNYEASLKRSHICLNSISFYMRILKAVYNMAVRKRMVLDAHPFQEVYTGIAKTRKRSLDIDTIRRIKQLKPLNKGESFARDIFLFSFYTRGMAFVDIAYLQKKNLQNGMLVYIRRKTGQTITIKWEQAMQDIINRHTPSTNSYLLPIIRKEGKKARNQYRYRQCQINKYLHDIGIRMGLENELTLYVARHTWASIAKSINVPLNIISEGLGHTSENMTNIYLKNIDESRLHKENSRIIQLLEPSM